jgi:MFS transporter, DHA1 family, tetracycline resistance protein
VAGVTDAAPAKRQAAVRFVFITALMDVISLGIMIPVLPNLVKAFVHGDTAKASLWSGAFSTVWALMQFVCSPIVGLMSDRFGRRPVLLVSIAGLGVDFLFMALAPSLELLFVGRIINGMTAASFSAAGAYIADVTPPEKRAQAFGLIGASWGIGFVVGPAIGGLLGDINLRLPFYAAAAMALCNWLYGYFVLPESLPPERRIKSFDWKKANPLGSLRLLARHPDLLVFGFIVFLFHMAHAVLPAIFVLYAGYRYGWTPSMMGVSLMITGVSNVIVQALLVKPVVRKLGERGALLVGLSCGAVGFVWFALASTQGWYWAGVPIFAMTGFIQPGLQGLMTRRVGPNEQGQLQGAGSCIMGLTGMIGPLIYTTTFAWAVEHDTQYHQPGAPILIAAAFMAVGFVVALLSAKHDGKSDPASTEMA